MADLDVSGAHESEMLGPRLGLDGADEARDPIESSRGDGPPMRGRGSRREA